MQTKIIFFDGSSLLLNEGDYLQPIIPVTVDGKSSASLAEPVELYWHIYDGLIPAILDVLLACDFFKVTGKSDAVYNSKAIVSIVNL